MAVTRAAAVIDALVARLGADPVLAGLVWDGPPVSGDPLPEVVTVGFAFNDDDYTAASITQELHELGAAAKRDETVDVTCAVMASNGDADMATARTRCITLLGAVESVLRADYSLGLTDVLRVELAVGTLRQAQTQTGAAAIVQFTVTATSLI